MWWGSYPYTTALHTSCAANVHHTVLREVLSIKSDRVRVDVCDDGQQYLKSRILETGDLILLAFGRHGFEMLEASEMIKVKQGPYAGEMYKTRFAPVGQDALDIKK